MSGEVVVFDVNETLLDVRGLLPRFEEILPGEHMGLWFAKMLHNSLVATASGSYEPFDRQGVAALIAVASNLDVAVTEGDAAWVVAGMDELPAHPDVAPALGLLKEEGFRLATLTNSSTSVLRAQINNSGLANYFERLISVEEIRVFKPAPETYHYAARELSVPVGGIRLVAAHDWDVTGALRAGALAAYVARKGAELGLLSETPDIIGGDMMDVARAIVAVR